MSFLANEHQGNLGNAYIGVYTTHWNPEQAKKLLSWTCNNKHQWENGEYGREKPWMPFNQGEASTEFCIPVWTDPRIRRFTTVSDLWKPLRDRERAQASTPGSQMSAKYIK